jgi:sucrose-6-phosphate hydrolase SacC (GH32 family)
MKTIQPHTVQKRWGPGWRHLFAALLVLLSWLAGMVGGFRSVQASANSQACSQQGWFPTEFGLKDHSVFWHDGFYYVVANYLPGERQFAYARSQDLCNWEELSPVLSQRTPGTWDERAVWAPFVFEEGGIYFMYFTGVTKDYTQSIMLATTADPSNPQSWQVQDLLFQPQHLGTSWAPNTWADCRDPSILKFGSLYYMVYTGRDVDGRIIGLALSTSPAGPWLDWGAVVTEPDPVGMLESPALFQRGQQVYLFYNDTLNGERYRIASHPGGPWSQAHPLAPGWAHEVWQRADGLTATSFLTSYQITIAPLSWDAYFQPARPFIGADVLHYHLPLLMLSNLDSG